MVVTDYHVQSVLRTYTRQLQKTRLGAVLGGEERTERSADDKVSISEEARRRLIRDRVTSQVLEKQREETNLDGSLSSP